MGAKTDAGCLVLGLIREKWYVPDNGFGIDAALLEAYHEGQKSEYRAIASRIRGLSRRVGVACRPDWIKENLESLANQLEVWAK